jgi:AhpD family alkylhydroperoxidase
VTGGPFARTGNGMAGSSGSPARTTGTNSHRAEAPWATRRGDPAHHIAFRRRIYRRPGDLLRDLAVVARHPRTLLRLLRGTSIEPAFRERLMLAVTATNRCRYCAALHQQMAVRAGVPAAEALRILHGSVGDAPPEQLPALLYAQAWAERDGRADVVQRAALRRLYGRDGAAAIEVALHCIRIGNLSGNTADFLLCRLSRGRHGCDPPLRTRRRSPPPS